MRLPLLIISCFLLLIVSCKEEKNHYELIKGIFENPELIDSICKSKGYIYKSQNKSQFIRSLKNVKNFERGFEKSRMMKYNGMDTEVSIVSIAVDDRTDYIEFCFINHYNNWELVTDLPLY